MLYAGPKLENGAAADAFATGVGALPRPPWVKRIVSDWRTVTTASAAVTASSLRLIPFTCQDLEITAVDFHVQGSVTAGTTVFVGIYAADPVTGLPGAKLWDNGAGTVITGANAAWSIPVTGVTSPPLNVWVATYISAGSTTQFVTGAITGDAEREYGIPTTGTLFNQVVALLASNTWAGAMPDTITWAANPFTTSGNVINSFLRMAAPA